MPRRCIMVVAELKEDFRRLIEHQRLIDRGVCEAEAHEAPAFEMRRRVVALMEAMFSNRAIAPGLLHPEVTLRCPGGVRVRTGVSEVSAYLAQTSKARAAAPSQSLRVIIRADRLIVTQHTAYVTVDFESDFARSQCFFKVSTAPPSSPYTTLVQLPLGASNSSNITSSSSAGVSAPVPPPGAVMHGRKVTASGRMQGDSSSSKHISINSIRSIDASFDVREFIEAIVREDAELRQHAMHRQAVGALTTHDSSPSIELDPCASPSAADLSDLLDVSHFIRNPSYFDTCVSGGDLPALSRRESSRKRTRTSGTDSAYTSEAFSFGDSADSGTSGFLDDPFDKDLLLCFSPLQGISTADTAHSTGRHSAFDSYADSVFDVPSTAAAHRSYRTRSSHLGSASGAGGSGGMASPLAMGVSAWTRGILNTSEV